MSSVSTVHRVINDSESARSTFSYWRLPCGLAAPYRRAPDTTRRTPHTPASPSDDAARHATPTVRYVRRDGASPPSFLGNGSAASTLSLCSALSDPPRACLMPQQIGWLKGGARWCGDFHIGLHRCPCRPPRHFKDGFPGSKYIDLEDPILFSMHFRPTRRDPPRQSRVWRSSQRSLAST